MKRAVQSAIVRQMKVSHLVRTSSQAVTSRKVTCKPVEPVPHAMKQALRRIIIMREAMPHQAAAKQW